jgi:hypothetical protein
MLPPAQVGPKLTNIGIHRTGVVSDLADKTQVSRAPIGRACGSDQVRAGLALSLDPPQITSVPST